MDSTLYVDVDGKYWQATEGNGLFPHLGFYRVFPKENYRDGAGALWELVAKRTCEFTFKDLFTGFNEVWIAGFENRELDGLILPKSVLDAGYTALKAVLKEKGWPSCTALEMYISWMQRQGGDTL